MQFRSFAYSAGPLRDAHLPRRPVFGWSSLGGPRSEVASVADLPHVTTTSGRAALYLALSSLALPVGTRVLVPTYHCPTMVAPVLCAGLTPTFFPIHEDGLPALESFDTANGDSAPKAMIAAHYFGFPRSFAKVQAWCLDRDITLIEDCAHSLFGMAGERPVGSWGDFSIASLTKFMPVPEAGLWASAHRPIPSLQLTSQGPLAQLRGVADVLEQGAQQLRFGGINGGLNAAFSLKTRLRGSSTQASSGSDTLPAAPESEADMVQGCDMGRKGARPLWAATVMRKRLPMGNAIARRQANFDQYADQLANVHGARPLISARPADAVPYVFPWRVDRPDQVYQLLRAQGMPVLRWDHRWPGMPAFKGDMGPEWSRHVLQLLCHQDLNDCDIARVTAAGRAAVVAAGG